MIEVWLLFLGIAGGSAGVGWLLGRRARESKAASESAHRREAPDSGPFPFGIGDALVWAKDQELLVEKIEILRDGGEPCAAILTGAAERGKAGMCVCFPEPRGDALWLRPVELPLDRDPPVTLEHEGHSFDRLRSIPVIVGESEAAMFAEYARGPVDRLIVLRTKARTIVAAGETVALARIERFPGKTGSPT